MVHKLKTIRGDMLVLQCQLERELIRYVRRYLCQPQVTIITNDTHTDKGVAKAADKKPSVREKLDRYKAAAKAEKEAERTVPEVSKEKPKTPEANRQTVHRQPKKSKKPKER